MAYNRRKLKAGLAAFVAFSLFVCVVTGGASARAPGRQIDFTPHVTDVGATPIPGEVVVPTPGPEQYFEEGDPGLPATLGQHGDGEFGWAEIAGHPGLALVWYTDRDGAHYLVVDMSSDAFLGTLDVATGERLEDGFEDYVRERIALEREMVEAGTEAFGSSGAAALALALLGACPETGGIGCVGALLVLAATGGGNTIRNIARIVGMYIDIGNVEDNFIARFQQTRMTSGQ